MLSMFLRLADKLFRCISNISVTRVCFYVKIKIIIFNPAMQIYAQQLTLI